VNSVVVGLQVVHQYVVLVFSDKNKYKNPNGGNRLGLCALFVIAISNGLQKTSFLKEKVLN
jgi:hypothetical protein